MSWVIWPSGLPLRRRSSRRSRRGGVVAISGDAGCAIGVPALADEAMALTVASAVGGSLSQGLVVVTGEDKEACTAQLNAIGDVALAKVAAASDHWTWRPRAGRAHRARPGPRCFI